MYFSNPWHFGVFLMEDVDKVECHTLLGNHDFLRALDEEIPTMIQLAFSVSDTCLQIFPVKTAVFRQYHDRQSTQCYEILTLVGRGDFLLFFNAIRQSCCFYESNRDLNLNEVIQITDSCHHWIDLLLSTSCKIKILQLASTSIITLIYVVAFFSLQIFIFLVVFWYSYVQPFVHWV